MRRQQEEAGNKKPATPAQTPQDAQQKTAKPAKAKD
jgi:hypothetical protein